MWWAGSERVVVYVGATSTCVAAEVATFEVPLAQPAAETTISAFEAAMKRISSDTVRSTRNLDLQLSGALARPFVFEAIGGLKSSREAQAVAATLAPEATGLSGPCVVWLDDWMPGRTCVAVAVETWLRDQIERSVRSHGLKVKAMRPWWSVAIDAAVSQLETAPRLLAVEDTDSLTVLTSVAGRYAALTTYAPKTDAAHKRAVVTRAAMTADVAPEEIATASLGEAPASNGVDVSASRPKLTLVPQVERWV